MPPPPRLEAQGARANETWNVDTDGRSALGLTERSRGAPKFTEPRESPTSLCCDWSNSEALVLLAAEYGGKAHLVHPTGRAMSAGVGHPVGLAP